MPTSSESSAAELGRIPVSVENALDATRAGLSRADAERADAYSLLGVFRSARQKQLERHAQLLAQKLGGDAPRVLALQNQRADLDAQLRDLRTAQAVASAQPPDPGDAGYVVHGFMRDAKREPTVGTTVAAYDANGRRRADFEAAATDVNGYFLLRTEHLINSTSTTGETKPTDPTTAVQLQLRVFNPRRLPLQATLPMLAAVPGSVDFVQIIAGDPATVITPPDQVTPVPAQPPRASTSANVSSKLKTLAAGLRQSAEPPQTPVKPPATKPTPSRTSDAKRKK